jgi:hypothetical protein
MSQLTWMIIIIQMIKVFLILKNSDKDKKEYEEDNNSLKNILIYSGDENCLSDEEKLKLKRIDINRYNSNK